MPLAKKHGLLGMIVPAAVGRARGGCRGRMPARWCESVGREGTGVRTFFSGHTSIGQYPILRFGTDQQQQQYLPASVRGVSADHGVYPV